MDITEQQRADLAARVRAERIRQFGAKSAAYRQAGLNATTWDRIEQGSTVRPDRLIAAVKALWPSSGGDWTRIDQTPADATPDLAEIEQRLAELESRIERLEVGNNADAARSSAAMNDAEGTSATDEQGTGSGGGEQGVPPPPSDIESILAPGRQPKPGVPGSTDMRSPRGRGARRT